MSAERSTELLLPAETGTYILVLRNQTTASIRIGRAGMLAIQPGYYLYVGSARGPGGIRARLGRHLRGTGKQRWHIDYLRAAAKPASVWVATGSDNIEHHWAAALQTLPGLVQPMQGFGSSDCACYAHLGFMRSLPSTQDIRSALVHSGQGDAVQAIEIRA